MKGYEDKQIQEAQRLIDEIGQAMIERRSFAARKGLNDLAKLLLDAKDMQQNPDLTLGKDISLHGGKDEIESSAKGSGGPKMPEA